MELSSGSVNMAVDKVAVYSAGPWCKDMGIEELMSFSPPAFGTDCGHGNGTHSRCMRVLEALKATALFGNTESNFKREVQLSSGGPGTGKVWTTPPSHAGQHLDNDHWRLAAALRLGDAVAPSRSSI